MTLEEFKLSLTQESPPDGLSDVLQALWQDGKGHWDAAHRLAQAISDARGAWVHAYLHRKEGDLGNAAYWYAHAGQPRTQWSLTQEWEHLVNHFLK